MLGYSYNIKQNNNYRVSITIPLNIGVGKYSLSCALVIGENHLDNCLHWLDYATDFEIAGNLGENFSGIVKLYPKVVSMKKIAYE
jgi:lipopolysaccharide transport system ATP-binding protein